MLDAAVRPIVSLPKGCSTRIRSSSVLAIPLPASPSPSLAASQTTASTRGCDSRQRAERRCARSGRRGRTRHGASIGRPRPSSASGSLGSRVIGFAVLHAPPASLQIQQFPKRTLQASRHSTDSASDLRFLLHVRVGAIRQPASPHGTLGALSPPLRFPAGVRAVGENHEAVAQPSGKRVCSLDAGTGLNSRFERTVDPFSGVRSRRALRVLPAIPGVPPGCRRRSFPPRAGGAGRRAGRGLGGVVGGTSDSGSLARRRRERGMKQDGFDRPHHSADGFDRGWVGHRRRQARIGLGLTPAQRLRWLEQTMPEMRLLLGRARAVRKERQE